MEGKFLSQNKKKNKIIINIYLQKIFRQKDFWLGYFNSKKEEIFTGVEVLIFVIDVESKGEDLDVTFILLIKM